MAGGIVELTADNVWNRASLVAQMVKNLPAMWETQGPIPRSGWSPAEGHGNWLQYSCLENLTDRGAWQATGHGVSKSWHDWASNMHNVWNSSWGIGRMQGSGNGWFNVSVNRWINVWGHGEVMARRMSGVIPKGFSELMAEGMDEWIAAGIGVLVAERMGELMYKKRLI